MKNARNVEKSKNRICVYCSLLTWMAKMKKMRRKKTNRSTFFSYFCTLSEKRRIWHFIPWQGSKVKVRHLFDFEISANSATNIGLFQYWKILSYRILWSLIEIWIYDYYFFQYYLFEIFIDTWSNTGALPYLSNYIIMKLSYYINNIFII